MKWSIEFFLGMVVVASALTCSEREDNLLVSIIIQAPSYKISEVNVSVINMLNAQSTSITESRTDSAGICSLKFYISHATFATLRIGDDAYDVYLEPKYKLAVSISKDNNECRYYGVGAEANNYLDRRSQILKLLEKYDGKYLIELDADEYHNRLGIVTTALTEFHHNFIDSIRLPDNIASLLDERNKIKVLFIREGFMWNYGVAHQFKIPKEVDMSDEIPFDSILLNSGMLEYSELLHFKMNIWSQTLSRQKLGGEASDSVSEIPLIMANQIESDTYQPYMKEFLLAKNVDFWMTLTGIGPPVDSLYLEFTRQHSVSAYLGSLQSRYDAFEAISVGRKAPAIKGFTNHGDSISSLQFKNKVIYVDVWASWCGPCQNEIPFSEKLQNVFQGNDSLVFLNVSVDANMNDWKLALEQNRNWGGVHVISDFSIYQTFKFNGIPRYILIDRAGNIISTDAERPSSGKVEHQIRKLLNGV